MSTTTSGDTSTTASSESSTTASGDSSPTSAQVLRAVVVGLTLDMGLSAAAYGVVRLLGGSVFAALLAGAVIAGVRAAWVVWRQRRVDPFALFVMGVFVVGLVLSLLSGSTTFLLLKESFVTAAAGLAFLLTCLGGGKPLAYHASQRVAAPTPGERAEWEQLWETEPVFRHRFVVMSVVFGVALLAEAAVRVVLVFLVPADVVVLVSTIMLPTVITAVSAWSIGYGNRTEAAVARSHETDGPDARGAQR